MSTAFRTSLVGGVAAALSALPLLELTQEAGWLVEAALAIALVIGVGYVARRLRVPAVLAAVFQLAVLLWWLGLLVAADLAWFGVFPSSEWLVRFSDVIDQGTEAITTRAAPVPVPDGILFFLVGGAGLIALLIDLLNAGLRKAVLTGVPLATGYAVTAGVFGGDIGWWWFLPPAIGYLALLITESRARVSAWGRSADGHGTSGAPATNTLARNGRRVGAVALSAAVAVPALIPVLSDGLIDGRGGGGGGSDGRIIRTDNPILDLQRNLTRPDNVDILRYTASDEAPHYIRTVTLDSFDGEVWKTSNRPVPESQRVSGGMPPPPGLDADDPARASFQFQVTENYSSDWLPLVYPAQEIQIEGDWRYDAATLDVTSPDEDVKGQDYSAVSLDIELTAERLQEAGRATGDVTELTELPNELPAIVTENADRVARGARGDFEKAAALQEWLRGPDFTYDLTTQPGTSSSALADFLRDRRGYCEQFAATMAIMARYLDIPARVAVGFTPGELQGDSSWLVRAHDAHAWVELYFEGVGWTPFDPTPAARTGSPPAWTIEPAAETPDSGTPSSQPTSTAPATDNRDPRLDEELLGGGGTTPEGSSRWPLVAAVVLAMVVLAGVPAGLARLLRWRRWQRAGESTRAIAAASWSEFSEAIRDAGLPWDPAATPRVVGRTVAESAGLTDEQRDLLDHLVTTTERARYSRQPDPVPALREDTAMFCRSLLRSRSTGQRVRAFLWPTTLRDAWAGTTAKVTAGLDWIDAARPRLRAALERGVRR